MDYAIHRAVYLIGCYAKKGRNIIMYMIAYTPMKDDMLAQERKQSTGQAHRADLNAIFQERKQTGLQFHDVLHERK